MRRPASSTGATTEQKLAEAQRIDDELRRISNLHLVEFTPPAKGVAALPELPRFDQVLDRAEAEHLRGTNVFQRSARRDARIRARAEAELHARRLLAEAMEEQREAQQAIDDAWHGVMSNSEDHLLPLLEEAFEDNGAPAAAVGLDQAVVQIVVLVPDIDAVPDRVPSATRAGNLSLRQMTKTTRAAVYRDLVAGHVIASAKEALVVGRGLEAASVVAARRRSSDGGGPTFVALLATRLERGGLAQATEARTPWELLDRVGQDTVANLRGVTRSLSPIDLRSQPEIRRVIDHITSSQ